MHQGHHGANHPVKDFTTGKVEITSMNHGFTVDREACREGVVETHVSLFDGSNCGLALEGRPVFSVQYHPEASPGPQDSHYLFTPLRRADGAGTLRRQEERSGVVNPTTDDYPSPHAGEGSGLTPNSGAALTPPCRLFIGIGGAQHGRIVEHPADDVQAGGQPAFRETAGNARGRLLGEIEGKGKGRPVHPFSGAVVDRA